MIVCYHYFRMLKKNTYVYIVFVIHIMFVMILMKVYTPNVLNDLKLSGFPIHKLVLKVGITVILLKNLD